LLARCANTKKQRRGKTASLSRRMVEIT
jgi:hypothetical protein